MPRAQMRRYWENFKNAITVFLMIASLYTLYCIGATLDQDSTHHTHSATCAH